MNLARNRRVPTRRAGEQSGAALCGIWHGTRGAFWSPGRTKRFPSALPAHAPYKALWPKPSFACDFLL
jgi:hypothetical protein